jgi:RimJ/RimL family protein N-acetyltransferase
MADLVITALEPQHLAQAEHWASRNAATKTLLKLPGAAPESTANSRGWVALDGNEMVAIVTVKLNKEHVGYINCIVKLTAKRQGIGTAIMEYAMAQPFVSDLIHLHAVIDPANTPALKVLDSLGFTRTGYDANGYVELGKHKYKT